MRAIVEGVNFIKKHTKPNPSKNIKGRHRRARSPIHVSNLMIICPECQQAGQGRGARCSEDGKSTGSVASARECWIRK